MSFLDKLFGKQVHVIDLNQAYDALHENASSSDPVGTIIWMDVDRHGNVIGSHKEIPKQSKRPSRREVKKQRESMQVNYLAQHPQNTPKPAPDYTATKTDHTFEEGFSGFF